MTGDRTLVLAACATALFATTGAVSIPSRFLCAFATNRWLSARTMLLLLMGVHALALVLLLVGGWALFAFVVVFGIAQGGLSIIAMDSREPG